MKCIVVMVLLMLNALVLAGGNEEQRPHRVCGAMPVPGAVVIEIPEDRTSQDSRASVLSDIPTKEILEEAMQRIAEIADQQRASESRPFDQESGTVCSRLFLKCHNALGKLKPCAVPLIFMGGVSTITADAIIYAGGSDTQTAGYVSLGVMVCTIIATGVYICCKHHHRKMLETAP